MLFQADELLCERRDDPEAAVRGGRGRDGGGRARAYSGGHGGPERVLRLANKLNELNAHLMWAAPVFIAICAT
jgi:hypothetical protein